LLVRLTRFCNVFERIMSAQPGSRWLEFAILLLLAAAFFATEPFFTHVDDEVWVIHEAAQPVGRLLGNLVAGLPRHPHPPLFDLVMTGWVRLTDAAPQLVRLPSLVFYLAALGVWGLCAARLAGRRALLATLWLGALWPYGFHYGRLAVWYALSFLLMGLVTLAYLRFLESRARREGIFFLAAAAALLYTNYYGWAILAGIALDFCWRERRHPAATWRTLLTSAALLALAFLPLWRPLSVQFAAQTGIGLSVLDRLRWLAAGGWTLFASEAVAPWYWWLSVPAAAGAAVAVLILVWKLPWPARRMFFGGGLLLAGLALLGVGPPRRLLLLAGWILVPAAAALVSLERRWLHAVLVLALAVPAAVGWYGVVAREYYLAPRFVEPWPEAVDAALAARRRGAVIVGNHPVFFYYLTARLRAEQDSRAPFTGVVPYTGYDAQVFNPPLLLAGPLPADREIVFVRGAQPVSAVETAEISALLESRCARIAEQHLLRDPGYQRKRRAMPAIHHPEWRISIHTYICPADAPAPGAPPER
jgi:hypothetical protein